jgi:hypothetical protein
MQKRFLLGCSALLLALFALDTSANAHGRYRGCECGSGYYGHYGPAYFPIYAPPSYTSFYYGTFRVYHARRLVRGRRR